ncbi:14378_t:CDS:1, partial [Funneliformis mosseae]
LNLEQRLVLSHLKIPEPTFKFCRGLQQLVAPRITLIITEIPAKNSYT